MLLPMRMVLQLLLVVLMPKWLKLGRRLLLLSLLLPERLTLGGCAAVAVAVAIAAAARLQMGEAPTATAAAAGAVWPHRAEGEAVEASPVLGGFPDPMHMYLCESRYIAFAPADAIHSGNLLSGERRTGTGGRKISPLEICLFRCPRKPVMYRKADNTLLSALARRVTPLLPLSPRSKPRKAVAAEGSE